MDTPRMIPARAARTDEVRAISLAVIAAVAVVAAAKFAAQIVAPTVVAALFALTLAPLVRRVERIGVPTTPAAALVVGACGVGLFGAAYILIPPLENWRAKAPEVLRTVEQKLRQLEHQLLDKVDGATARGPLTEEPETSDAAEKVIETGQGVATEMLLSAPEVLAAMVYCVFLCFLLLAERGRVRRFVLSLASRPATRLRLSKAIRDMRLSVGQYLFTFTLINLGLGVAAGLIFWWAGLPSPALWGAVTALLNFIPVVGPLITNLIVFAVGIVTFPDVLVALYLVLALIALNVIEGQIVTPLLVGRRVEIGALPVFLSVAFGAWLWGVPGALAATPTLIVCHRFWLRMTANPIRVARRLGKAA